MKNIISMLITILLLSVVNFSAIAGVKENAHTRNFGVTCQDCHSKDVAPNKTKKLVMNASCIKCHTTRPSLKEKEVVDVFGDKFSVNPHDAHIGKIRCTLCHSAHSTSKLYCNNCHKFDLEIPNISK